jgi:hypothetical protein
MTNGMGHRVVSDNKNLGRPKSKNSENVKKRFRLIAIHKAKYQEIESVNGRNFAPINDFRCGEVIVRALEDCVSHKRSIAFVRHEGMEIEIVDAKLMPSILKMAIGFQTPVASREEAMEICAKYDLQFVLLDTASTKKKPSEEEEGDEEE